MIAAFFFQAVDEHFKVAFAAGIEIIRPIRN
jgi:hypothetical protein